MKGRLPNVMAAVLKTCVAALLLAPLSPAFAQTPERRPGASNQASSPQPRDGAQTGERQTEAPTTPQGAGVPADLSITAHVTAKSLRFEKVPNPQVVFTGEPGRDTVWDSQRENLPQQVRPGVTYRNIGITLRITSVFADIDRIVAEALGEVPASDGAQPQPSASEQPSPPSSSQRNPDGDAQGPGHKDASSAGTTLTNASVAPQRPEAQATPHPSSPAHAQQRRARTLGGRNR